MKSFGNLTKSKQMHLEPPPWQVTKHGNSANQERDPVSTLDS